MKLINKMIDTKMIGMKIRETMRPITLLKVIICFKNNDNPKAMKRDKTERMKNIRRCAIQNLLYKIGCKIIKFYKNE